MMNKYEDFACQQYLSYYPRDKEFTEITDILRDEKKLEEYNDLFDEHEHDDSQDSQPIIIWEPFERYPGEDVAQLMENTLFYVNSAFGADND